VCKDLQDQAKIDRNFLSKVFVFPKMKIHLKQRLKDTVEIQAESQGMPDSITKWEFQRCLQQWERHWARCINSKWDYSEGDSIVS
jgi:hypothetical protein